MRFQPDSLRKGLYVILLCLLAGCSEGPPHHANTVHALRTNDSYEMSAAERTQFLAALNTLKIGDASEHVRSLLGPPFEEAVIRGKKIDDPVRGTLLTYYLKKAHGNLVNEKEDEYISLVFDQDNTLTRLSTNLVELPLHLRMTNASPSSEPDHPD